MNGIGLNLGIGRLEGAKFGIAAPSETVLHKVDLGRTSGGTISGWEDDSGYLVAGTIATSANAFDDSDLTYKANALTYSTVRYQPPELTFVGLTPGGTYIVYVICGWDTGISSTTVVINGVNVGTVNFPVGNKLAEGRYVVAADGAGKIYINGNVGTPFGVINALVLAQ